LFNHVMPGQLSLFDFIKIDELPVIKELPQEKKKYKTIKPESMQVVEESNFVEICTDSRILISATVKRLDGNMVYVKAWYLYPFLTICKDEADAKKMHQESVKRIKSDTHLPKRFQVCVPVELQEMYYCKNGNISCEQYAMCNGAVEE
jgi:hypothetical protein